MPHLVRLTYYSFVYQMLSKGAIHRLLETSSVLNEKNGITGALYMNKKYFVQILEGERLAISETFGRIIRDGRHTDPVLMGCVPIKSRVFGQWSMVFLGNDENVREIFFERTRREYFEPQSFTEESIVETLTAITRRVADHLVCPELDG